MKKSSFWKPYLDKEQDFQSQYNGQLSKYPFFHSTGLTQYEKIVEKYWVLQDVKPDFDEFHQDKAVFFFYANPIYFNEKWDFPIILGFDFKENKNNFGLSPTDTGLTFDLTQYEGSKHEERGIDYFRNNFIAKNLELSAFYNVISKYIEEWFGDIDNYCTSCLKNGFECEAIGSHECLQDFFEEDLTKFYTDKYLKNSKILLDRRKKTIELAIFNEVNLPQSADLRYAAVPSSRTETEENEHVTKLMEQFKIQQSDREKVFFEYKRRRKDGSKYSLRYITRIAIENYYTRFNIKADSDFQW